MCLSRLAVFQQVSDGISTQKYDDIYYEVYVQQIVKLCFQRSGKIYCDRQPKSFFLH